MKKDKSRSAGSMIIAILILMLTLTACGKSEFGVTEKDLEGWEDVEIE